MGLARRVRALYVRHNKAVARAAHHGTTRPPKGGVQKVYLEVLFPGAWRAQIWVFPLRPDKAPHSLALVVVWVNLEKGPP